MAQSEYLLVADVKRYFFTQYSQGSVASFSTQFNIDWASNLSVPVQALATTAAPTVAILIILNQVLLLNPTDWIGFNNGTWSVVANSKMSGSLYVASSV